MNTLSAELSDERLGPSAALTSASQDETASRVCGTNGASVPVRESDSAHVAGC